MKKGLQYWECPTCGPRSDVAFYDDSAGIFNAHSRRFGPWCTVCGHRVLLSAAADDRNVAAGSSGRAVLVLSGTCASGKSRVSLELAKHHGYVQIDGDWVWTMLKAESGRKIAADAIHVDLLEMAYGVAVMGYRAVVAHVVRPAEFQFYREFLAERQVSMCGVVLQPTESIALDRNRRRKCWPKTTPDYWVRHFLDEYAAWSEPDGVIRYDNSSETPAETASRVAKLFTTLALTSW